MRLTLIASCCVAVMATTCLVQAQEVFVASFRTRNHRVAGDVYALSDSVLEVRNFSYDGTAPRALFWASTTPSPARDGIILPNPSSGCGDDELPLSQNVPVERIEFPSGVTIRDFLGGSLSVWCVPFNANFGDLVIAADLDLSALPTTANGPALQCSETIEDDEPEVPLIATTPDGYNCEPLNDDYQVRWQVDGQEVAIELVAAIPNGSYMGFGVSGSDTKTLMDDADTIVADMLESGEPRVRDFYIEARSQCSQGGGVCPDTEGGFINDRSAVEGSQDFGLTLIKYRRPLIPVDMGLLVGGQSVDKSISSAPGEETFIVWALGPISPQTGFPNFHSIDFAKKDISFDFGRAIEDNCLPLVTLGETPAPTSTPPPGWRRPFVGDKVTEITARIGPSGGPRGYTAITGGLVSWGIAWYMGDINEPSLLIPEIVMRRNTTYKILVNGGDDPGDNANFHPMYITTSQFGGYADVFPLDRLDEVILAGIDIIESSPEEGVTEYVSTAKAPICRFETTSATTQDVELGAFEDYYDTLDTACVGNQELSAAAAVIEFTPDENTPDIVYYQCVTHRNLGYKIIIIDADDESLTMSPTIAPSTPPTPSPTIDDGQFDAVVELEGFLVGSTLRYTINIVDPEDNTQNTISVSLTVPAVGWVGFALNDNGGFMIGSEAIIGVPADNTVLKYNLNAQARSGVEPFPDDQQTLMDTSITQTSSTTTLSFTKFLEEGDEVMIDPTGVNTFLTAFGSGNTLAQHAPNSRASFTLDLISGGTSTLNVREQSLWKAHGFMASIAWGLLSPLAIGAALLRKYFPGDTLWFEVHRGLNLLVVTFTVIAFALAVAAINQETPDGADARHFDADPNPHRAVGLAIFIIALTQAVNGLFRPHAPKSEDKSGARTAWEIGHRVLGVTLLAMSWYQVQAGVKIYSDLFDADESRLISIWWGITGGISSIIIFMYVASKLTGETKSSQADETKAETNALVE